jgi:hypothetical protein
VRLHKTVVVDFHANGDVVLDSGGWLTVTTKDRQNQALGRYSYYGGLCWGVYSDRGIWYVHKMKHGHYDGGENFPYADGITLHPDGTVSGQGEDPRAKLKLRRQIRAYCKDYMEAFTDGSYPLHGDGDHILSHMSKAERYYVPTLLSRAVERFPVSQWAMHHLAVAWNPEEAAARGYELKRDEIGHRQLRKSLQRFLYELMGTAG